MINDTCTASAGIYRISWEPLTLVEARGFVTNYCVTLQLENTQEIYVETVVAHDISEVIIAGLDFSRSYIFSIAVKTKNGQMFSPFESLFGM